MSQIPEITLYQNFTFGLSNAWNGMIMGDVVSYFHIFYLYSNILLIVIPVK